MSEFITKKAKDLGIGNSNGNTYNILFNLEDILVLENPDFKKNFLE